MSPLCISKHYVKAEVPTGTGAADILFDEEKYFENLLPEIDEPEAEEDDIEDKNLFIQ